MVEKPALSQAVIEGQYEKTAQLTTEVLGSGTKPNDIISEILQPAMDVVGERFSSGAYFLPDMLKAGRAMTNAMEVIKPLLFDTGVPILGKVVLGTVKGDVHDIGKNMVGMFLKGVGFEVFDLGVDVPDEKFVEAVRDIKPDILGISALLTTTMPSIGTIIKALEVAGLRSDVKVVVGGASVSQDYADRSGADAYGRDAGSSARVCKEIVRKETL